MTQAVAGAWSVLTAGGTSESFKVQPAGTMFVSSVVTSVVGSTPSLQVFLDVQNVAGAWVQVAALTAQTATGTQTATVGPSASVSELTNIGRLRWAVSGTGPVFGAAIAAFSA